MSDDLTRLSVNEILIKLMAARVKGEVQKLVDAGMDTAAINTLLAESILPYYEHWRAETLARVMHEVEGMGNPSVEVSVAPMSSEKH